LILQCLRFREALLWQSHYSRFYFPHWSWSWCTTDTCLWGHTPSKMDSSDCSA